MGKTKRKVQWYAGKSREFYIKEQIDGDYVRNLRHGVVWVKRSYKERNEEYLERKPAFDRAMAEYNLKMEIANERLEYLKERYGNNPLIVNTFCYSWAKFPEKPFLYINKMKKVPFEDDYDTFFKKNYEEESRRYDEMMRDGKICETSRSSGFKREVKRKRRNHDKKVLQRILRDEEYYYDASFYGNKDGKAHVWDWW